MNTASGLTFATGNPDGYVYAFNANGKKKFGKIHFHLQVLHLQYHINTKVVSMLFLHLQAGDIMTLNKMET